MCLCLWYLRGCAERAGLFFPRGCLLLVAFSSLALHCGPDFSVSCTLTYRKVMSSTGSVGGPGQKSESHRTTIGMDTDSPSTETSDRGLHVPILRASNYMDWRRRLIGRLGSKDLHLCASRPLSDAAKAVLQVAINDRSRGFHSPLEWLDFAAMDAKIAKELKKEVRTQAEIIQFLDEANLRLVRGCYTSYDILDSLNTFYLGTMSAQISALTTELYARKFSSGDRGQLLHHLITIQGILQDLEACGSGMPPAQQSTLMLDSVFDPQHESFTSSLHRPLALPSEIVSGARSYQFKVSLASRINGLSAMTSGRAMAPSPVPALVAQGESQKGARHKRRLKKGNRDGQGNRRPTDSTCHACGAKGHWSCDAVCPEKRSKSSAAPALVAMNSHSVYLAGSSSRAPDADFVWIADTGAGHHFVGDRSLLSDFKESPIQVQMADNSLGQATGYGRMSVKTSQGHLLNFKEMYYLPGSKYGLISMSSLRAGGAKLVYGHGEDTQQVWLDGSLIAKIVKTNAKQPSYVFDFEIVSPPSPVLVAATRASVGASLMEWHRNFGHMAPSSILQLVKSKAIVGIRLLDKEIEDCEPCIIAKARAGSHKHFSRKPGHVLQRVLIDLGFVNDDDTNG
ncbi:BQ5605_C011g06358 [Microbotryum silenes-dioicae]|uniref:BQ5605_C011g06358 protein n=1 Tax=Microbotryum silenes-dioicae TaxID=796604 RepID=A0A2X0NRM0_9BASI|nr:BQ5605_C011g06358 [Microbotryum silenes-dioicae]